MDPMAATSSAAGAALAERAATSPAAAVCPSACPSTSSGSDDVATEVAARELMAAIACGASVKRCLNCRTTATPMWRAGPLGAKTLCNACGIRFKLNKPLKAGGAAPAPVKGPRSARARLAPRGSAANPYARPVRRPSLSGGGAYASGRASRGGPAPLLTVDDCVSYYDPSRAVGQLGFDKWLKQEKMGRSARAFGQQDLQLLRAAPEGADAPGASHAS